MGCGSTVLDASNEVIRGHQPYEINWCENSPRSTKGYFILMLQGGASSYMKNINMNWDYFADHFTGGKKVDSADPSISS